MIGLSYKQKCNNFGYHSIEVQPKGNYNAQIAKNIYVYKNADF